VGIIFLWQQEVFDAITGLVQNAKLLSIDGYCIIDLENGVLLHLVPIANNFNPNRLNTLQQKYQAADKQLIHLWEDVWLTKKKQVLGRLKSLFSKNIGFHARKTKTIEIDAQTAKSFLETNHLQGFVKAKYAFGLITNDEIIAVATFSEVRPMKLKGYGYFSAELVRFASKDGTTVVGGLSKLVKHFCKLVQVNDIMSYADKDWSLGRGYEKLKFVKTTETEPIFFYLNKQTLKRYAAHRLPKNMLQLFKDQNSLNLDEFLNELNYTKVFNTGNLKYHLYL
jgi:hypothetical protein